MLSECECFSKLAKWLINEVSIMHAYMQACIHPSTLASVLRGTNRDKAVRVGKGDLHQCSTPLKPFPSTRER